MVILTKFVWKTLQILGQNQMRYRWLALCYVYHLPEVPKNTTAGFWENRKKSKKLRLRESFLLLLEKNLSFPNFPQECIIPIFTILSFPDSYHATILMIWSARYEFSNSKIDPKFYLRQFFFLPSCRHFKKRISENHENHLWGSIGPKSWESVLISRFGFNLMKFSPCSAKFRWYRIKGVVSKE